MTEATKKVLKEVVTIGNSAVMRYPVTVLPAPDKSVIAFIDVKELGEDEFDPYGLFYLSEFISLLDFFPNAETTMDDGIITLKTDRAKQKYRTSDVSKMKGFDVPAGAIEKMLSVDPIAEVSISADDLANFTKIAGILKLDHFVIDFKDEPKVVITTLDEGRYTDPSEFNVTGKKEEDFAIVISMKNITRLPSYDYNVKIIRNPQSGNIITVWETIDAPMNISVSVETEL